MTDAIQFHVDQAGSVDGLKCGSANYFSGWVHHNDDADAISFVRFEIEGNVLGVLPIKQERQDLKNMFRNVKLGFCGPVMISLSSLGFTLTLKAVSSNGTIIPMTSFVLDNKVSTEELEFKKAHNLPDDMLRHLVVQNIDPAIFLEHGKEGVEFIRYVLNKNSIDILSMKNILDFGVGCGRILRWWQELSSEIKFWGTDINETLIDWCRQKIPFANYALNSILPPTGFKDGQFDMLYVYSVFTHLTLETQMEWMGEFKRILSRPGYAIISVHGDVDAASLEPESYARYQKEGFLVTSGNAEGENMCAVFQNREMCERMFSRHFSMVDHLPGARKSTSKQDIYLLKSK